MSLCGLGKTHNPLLYWHSEVEQVEFDRMLILAPHTDDGELGCGGTIAKAVDRGIEVRYVAFSSADRSLSRGFKKGTLKQELYAATKVLGLPKRSVYCLSYEVRTFSENRQGILDDMLKLREEFNPEIVLAPSLNDLHQDHKTVAEECRRMLKRTTILGYEMPWNNISFDTLSFSILDRKHIDKKMAALQCYESQRHREYLSSVFIESLARTRGVQINAEFAEAFEVVRLIIR